MGVREDHSIGARRRLSSGGGHREEDSAVPWQTQYSKRFRVFRAAGEGATKKKGDIVNKIIEALTVHTYIENESMYPWQVPDVRKRVPDVEYNILESYEEHHVADVLVMELAALSPDSEWFDAKTTVLIENVEHYIDEEKSEWFPKVRRRWGVRNFRSWASTCWSSKRRHRVARRSLRLSRRQSTPSSSNALSRQQLRPPTDKSVGRRPFNRRQRGAETARDG